MSYRVITPPAAEPITLGEAKAHLRVVGDDEDALIAGLITAAREMVEARTNRALMPRTVECITDGFDEGMALPLTPYLSALSVMYTDTTGVSQLLDAAAYWVNPYTEPPKLHAAYGGGWPSARYAPAAVVIRYEAGYPSPDAIPASLKQWMLLAIGTMYENRETEVVGTITSSIADDFTRWLWHPYKVYV